MSHQNFGFRNRVNLIDILWARSKWTVLSNGIWVEVNDPRDGEQTVNIVKIADWRKQNVMNYYRSLSVVLAVQSHGPNPTLSAVNFWSFQNWAVKKSKQTIRKKHNLVFLYENPLSGKRTASIETSTSKTAQFLLSLKL